MIFLTGSGLLISLSHQSGAQPLESLHSFSLSDTPDPAAVAERLAGPLAAMVLSPVFRDHLNKVDSPIVYKLMEVVDSVSLSPEALKVLFGPYFNDFQPHSPGSLTWYPHILLTQ